MTMHQHICQQRPLLDVTRSVTPVGKCFQIQVYYAVVAEGRDL
jgi:hypothetical protein